MKTHPPRESIRVPHRILLIHVVLLLAALSLPAAPFRDLPLSFTQPDGTKIELRGTGDEFYAVFETLDGYTVLFDQARRAYCFAQAGPGGDLVSSGVEVQRQDPAALGLTRHLRAEPAVRLAQVRERRQRWEEETQIGQRWRERKAALRQLEAQSGDPLDGIQPGPPSNPTIGNRLGLTLLIDFDDDPATIPQEQIVDFCNGDNFTGFGNNGSVKQYFKDNSNGLLIYSNVVTIYIRIPNSLHPKSYYNDTDKGAGTQGRLLIRDAMTILTNLPNYATEILPTFEGLSVDGSDNVIAFNVFYAGDNGGVWSMGLWPHSGSISPTIPLWSGSKKLRRYQITNIGDKLTIGTFIHENGHMLCSYPDLYDYTYDSNGAGDWCLMAYGGPAANPVQICAYLKRASGWATTTALTSTSYLTATVSAVGTNFNHFYRFQKPGSSTEYFLAEGRYKTGRDAGLPGSGVLIWHIDELGDNSTVNLNPNTTHNNFEATLVQADNKWHLEKDVNYGDSSDLYYSGNTSTGYANLFSDSSAPHAHWWNGNPSGVKFSGFSVRGTNMTFVVGDPPLVAIFNATPTSGAAPLTDVVFSDLSTGQITNRSWDFGDGSTLPSTMATNVLHTYLNAGTYSPRLTVTGPTGTSTTNRLSYIVVTNTIPVASFAANQTHGLAPFRVLFANTSSGLITNASWNFGEGGILSTNASAVSHTYSNAGTYSVSLTVMGPGGTGATNRANYILVTNGPPIAAFVASATNGPAPLHVTFTNTSLGLVDDAVWEFGDGHTNRTLAPILANTYAVAGIYTASLRVSGPLGTNATSSIIVITNAIPEPAFVTDRQSGHWPLTVWFTNRSAYATNYAWSFGDGATTVTTSTNELRHTFDDAGTYSVCLTASGLGGISTCCSNNLIVVTNPPPPTVRLLASLTSGAAPLMVWFTNLTVDATNYAWNFGDGTAKVTTSTNELWHTYDVAGTYSACLTATGPGGTTTGCGDHLIVVTNPPLNIVAYGDNSWGQCDLPARATNVVAIAAGAWHNLVLVPEGQILAWGDNSSGQCDVPASLQNPVAIAAGGYHSLAIQRGGTVIAWGAGDYGQTSVPSGLAGVVGIAAGTWHSAALRSNGTVVVWGDNTFGQANQPAGLADVVAVAAGGNHTLALKADGTVTAWGENTDAEGNGAGQSVVPYGLADVVAIGAGGYHSLAVKRDGTLVTWGANSQNQCIVPTALADAKAVAGGGGHSVALVSSGAVSAWGANWNGQCDPPATLTSAVSIAAGEYHTLVLLPGNPTPPRLLNPSKNGNRFSALVQTVNGREYALEFMDSLAATSWTGVCTNTGDGMLQELADPNATGAQRFYRVRVW